MTRSRVFAEGFNLSYYLNTPWPECGLGKAKHGLFEYPGGIVISSHFSCNNGAVEARRVCASRTKIRPSEFFQSQLYAVQLLLQN